MSRSAAAVLAELLALLPPGWAWDREPEGSLAPLLAPLAAEMAGLEAEAAQLLVETDPLFADTLIGDYERVLGPDPCGGDALAMTLSDRQMNARRRWTTTGQPTPAFFVALAAAAGIAVRVEELRPRSYGEAEYGVDEYAAAEQVFNWIVHAPTDAPAVLSCILAAWSPAHTTLILSRDGAV